MARRPRTPDERDDTAGPRKERAHRPPEEPSGTERPPKRRPASRRAKATGARPAAAGPTEPAPADLPEEVLAADRTLERARAALRQVPAGAPIGVALDPGPDALAAGAILAAAIERSGRVFVPVLPFRGEAPGDPPFMARLEAIGGPLAIGVGQSVILAPARGGEEISLSKLAGARAAAAALAFALGRAIADIEDRRWLVGLGELAAFGREVTRTGASSSALAVALALVGAARRAANPDLATALGVLRGAPSPDPIADLATPEAEALARMRTEVALELRRARKAPIEHRGDLVIARIASPCAIHPLLAEALGERFSGRSTLVLNAGYVPGRVDVALRRAPGAPLPNALASVPAEGWLTPEQAEALLAAL
jgi:single-stranded-DNA-specific exonuclease